MIGVRRCWSGPGSFRLCPDYTSCFVLLTGDSPKSSHGHFRTFSPYSNFLRGTCIVCTCHASCHHSNIPTCKHLSLFRVNHFRCSKSAQVCCPCRCILYSMSVFNFLRVPITPGGVIVYRVLWPCQGTVSIFIHNITISVLMKWSFLSL